MELNIVAVTINQQLCDPKYKKALLENYYLFNDRVKISANNLIINCFSVIVGHGMIHIAAWNFLFMKGAIC